MNQQDNRDYKKIEVKKHEIQELKTLAQQINQLLVQPQPQDHQQLRNLNQLIKTKLSTINQQLDHQLKQLSFQYLQHKKTYRLNQIDTNQQLLVLNKQIANNYKQLQFNNNQISKYQQRVDLISTNGYSGQIENQVVEIQKQKRLLVDQIKQSKLKDYKKIKEIKVQYYQAEDYELGQAGYLEKSMQMLKAKNISLKQKLNKLRSEYQNKQDQHQHQKQQNRIGKKNREIQQMSILKQKEEENNKKYGQKVEDYEKQCDRLLQIQQQRSDDLLKRVSQQNQQVKSLSLMNEQLKQQLDFLQEQLKQMTNTMDFNYGSIKQNYDHNLIFKSSIIDQLRNMNAHNPKTISNSNSKSMDNLNSITKSTVEYQNTNGQQNCKNGSSQQNYMNINNKTSQKNVDRSKYKNMSLQLSSILEQSENNFSSYIKPELKNKSSVISKHKENDEEKQKVITIHETNTYESNQDEITSEIKQSNIQDSELNQKMDNNEQNFNQQQIKSSYIDEYEQNFDDGDELDLEASMKSSAKQISDGWNVQADEQKMKNRKGLME